MKPKNPVFPFSTTSEIPYSKLETSGKQNCIDSKSTSPKTSFYVRKTKIYACRNVGFGLPNKNGTKFFRPHC